MTEFKVGKDIYRAGRLNALQQLHVLRRLTPCLAKTTALASGNLKLKYDGQGKMVDFDGNIDAALSPLAEALAAMSDADVDYIFHACLEVTERKQAGGAWAVLRIKGVTMFDSLTLPALLQIAYHVVRENLTDFFGELPSLSGLEGLLKARGLLG